MSGESPRSAFWPCFWMAVALAGAKAVYWSLPEPNLRRLSEYATDLAVSSHADVLFAFGVGVAGQAALRLTARRARAHRAVWVGLVASCAVCVLYAAASVQVFAYLRSPLTYPLLYLAGDMRSMRSSLGSFASASLVLALAGAPLAYLAALRATASRTPPLRTRLARGLGMLALVVYALAARHALAGAWGDRDDHLIAESPHWALAASLATELLGGGVPTLAESFPPGDLGDFEAAAAPHPRPASAPAPRNVVLIVLESTGDRYLSLYGSPYDTTPRLLGESAHALVFDSFYCHVGLTANSMAAISLSIYPYMTWREYTQDHPDYPGRTLADLFHARGHRTAFLHSGDLDYVGQRQFLRNRGFDTLLDVRDLSPEHQVSSWGGEDRILYEGALRWIDQDGGRPFYLMLWSIQSHHPYEPSPGWELVDFFHGALPPDDYDLGRYLNTLREEDLQLGRLFDGLRERGLAEDTLVVITGDHGEAFGDPHRTWGHGARLYEENVRVPLVLWSPRLFPEGRRVATIGSHADLNPTVADLLGLAPPEGWQGRSLFDPSRPPRAYFYAASDDYLLGVREEGWKYVYDATTGRDELYDLPSDPAERRNVAAQHPERCGRLRQRLAAWRDYAGRQLARARPAG